MAKATPRQETSPKLGLEAMKALILDVPDFPKKGIMFKDITPLLADPQGFNAVIDALILPFKQKGIEIVAGVESRGFLLAPAMAARLGAGIVPLRKKGKLPRKVHSASYDLEYGTDSIEAHTDAFPKGSKILLVDDVLATGGTAAAAISLIEALGGKLIGSTFLIELCFLNGRKKLAGQTIHSVLTY
ncbi:MAG: adenine phosphoribosyltransferase [Elusimicrobia bacterium]|nr:adenine phosphoribosyltransferase [Elusimicrobiota bacterium]